MFRGKHKKLYTLLLTLIFAMGVTACGAEEKAFTLQRRTFNEEAVAFSNAVTDLEMKVPVGYVYSTEEYITK